MPPHRRNCPDLERALPSDLPPGGIVLRDPAEALFGDGKWRSVVIVQEWCRDGGRYLVQLEWRADGSTWSGEFLHDDEKLR